MTCRVGVLLQMSFLGHADLICNGPFLKLFTEKLNGLQSFFSSVDNESVRYSRFDILDSFFIILYRNVE
jgi:hypothetical protein